MAENEIVFMVEEAEEGGYDAHALGAEIFTQADGREELRKMVREAVSVHFEEGERPSTIRLLFVERAGTITL
jgi:predicted RNase H-like HicB family nuclease